MSVKMSVSDFKIECDTLLMKKYDGTMCGIAPHYNWVTVATVNRRVLKNGSENTLLSKIEEMIINFDLSTN